MAESGTDLDSWNGNWILTLTGTGLVSRIDVIGLVWIRELELMFLSRIDVIGLGCGSGNLERNSLAGSGTLHCLAEFGTFTAWRIRDLDRNGTGESDRCDRTRLDPELELMFLSRIDVIGLGCGSGNLTAWRNPGP